MEKRAQNPLLVFLIIAVVSICQDMYRLIFDGRIDWLVCFRGVLFIPFVILYFRRSSSAWSATLVIYILFALEGLVYFLTKQTSNQSKPEPLLIAIVVYGACLIYILAARDRYHKYVKDFASAPNMSD